MLCASSFRPFVSLRRCRVERKGGRIPNMKKETLHSWVILLCSYFAVLSGAQAVSPAPDGCYPNFTTAEGCNALAGLGSGVGNTGLGWYSLFSAADANNNTGIGAGALALASTGADSNTAVGTAAMLLNTSGPGNTAVGANALLFNDNGSGNNAVGAFALYNNVGGTGNNAIGVNALLQNHIGAFNTAVGQDALEGNDASGQGLGAFNTAVGSGALSANSDGDSNTAVGAGALRFNTTGSSNTAIGFQTLANFVSGLNNVAVGESAGSLLTAGDFNIYINNAGVGNESHTIRIGTPGLDGPTFIAGIHGAIASGGAAVFVSADGQLGTSTSSERFKEDIRPMDKASEAILALQPVTFRYKQKLDPRGIPQFGLVAEQVEKINPDLIARDQEGKPYTVRYEAVNAMLLNEFLKEHRKVEQMQKQIDALTAGLQRVSAQLEVSKPVPRKVVNNSTADRMAEHWK